MPASIGGLPVHACAFRELAGGVPGTPGSSLGYIFYHDPGFVMEVANSTACVMFHTGQELYSNQGFNMTYKAIAGGAAPPFATSVSNVRSVTSQTDGAEHLVSAAVVDAQRRYLLRALGTRGRVCGVMTALRAWLEFRTTPTTLGLTMTTTRCVPAIPHSRRPTYRRSC